MLVFIPAIVYCILALVFGFLLAYGGIKTANLKNWNMFIGITALAIFGLMSMLLIGYWLFGVTK
jgi:predicted permease